MRSLILNILFFGWTLTLAAVALVIALFGGSTRLRWFIGFWGRSCLWLTRTVLNAHVEIRGLERHRAGGPPALIVSKHQSELDTFVPLGLFPDLAAIAMAELQRYPLVGPIIRRLDYILVSVEGGRRDLLRSVVRGAERVHAQGRPILIYPEGELMRVGARERYRTGVFHIYEALGVPATPVALSTGLVWPQRRWRKHAGRSCVVEFMEPIPPGLDKETFMSELERRIETRSMELIREHGDPEVVAVAEERHRLGLNNADRAEARQSAERVDAATEAGP